MDPQQVFKHFDGPHGKNPVRFCAACGAPCIDIDHGGGHVYRTCSACGREHYHNPSPTVTVLVVQGETLLLCLREERMFRGGKWCMPGGFMDFGEDFLTAGRREVREETGLEVRIKSILSVTSSFHAPEMSSISVVMLAEPIGGEASPQDETQAVSWHPFHEPLPEMAFEHHEHLIQRYLATRFEGAPVDPRYAGGPTPVQA